MSKITAVKVLNEKNRQDAIKVIKEVYKNEKNWINDPNAEIPENIGESKKYSWFIAKVNGKPAGVIKLTYDPNLEFPPDFKVTLNQDIDLEKVAKMYKIVDIGRFMILPKYRKKIMVALRLMKIAIKEVIKRDYTHFITDVFEGEQHSPLGFHTRILGFEVIGKHIHGELNCSCTRIILTLDILKNYKRLKEKKNKVFNIITSGGVSELIEKRIKQQEKITA